MITLFNINNYNIDTSKLGNILHGEIVEEFEQVFAEYVGAKHACFANSASSLLYLTLKGLNTTIKIPSIMPVVVPNVIYNSGNKIEFYDDIDWVGSAYEIYPGVWDSAQEVTKNGFNKGECAIYSFYPTKPVGGCDGGMIVSNNKYTIDKFKAMVLNGTSFDKDNWERRHSMFGYKMHGNSIQAKIAYENLKKYDRKSSVLNEIKDLYNKELGYNNKSLHLYRIRVADNQSFLKNMKKVGIQCGIHYSACHKSDLMKNVSSCRDDMEKSEKENHQTISIPFHENLKENDINKILHNINKFKSVKEAK
jgi:perosamine synthetase